MRIAVIADVHANEHALDAVLERIEREKPDARVCLGDLVGYNARPSACIAKIRANGFRSIMGNHDHGVARGTRTVGTNATAQRVMAWTRERLAPDEIAYLEALPRVLVDPEWTAVHGCFLDDAARLVGYVTPFTMRMNLRALSLHDGWPKVGLCGHHHMPLSAWLDGGGCEEPAFETTVTWPKTATAVILNPGSVGQPRDGDPRASFAIVDVSRRSAELHRVHYDIDAAVRAITDAGLPPELGTRLYEAR